MFAELYLVNIAEEKELKEDELGFDEIGEILPSYFTSLAVPKSASIRCH